MANTWQELTALTQDEELVVKNEAGDKIGTSGGVSISVVDMNDLPGVTR